MNNGDEGFGTGASPPAPRPPRRRWSRWRPSIKVVIPTLIAITSVTGVAIGWRSAELGGDASSLNRELIRQTVEQKAIEARVELQISSDSQTFARYRTEILAAKELDALATALRGAGLPDRAASATDEARIRTDMAEQLVAFAQLGPYVNQRDPTVDTWEHERRQIDLAQSFKAGGALLDPVGAANKANRLDARSQRLVGWIVAFAVVGFVLTVAQVNRRPRVKWVLAAVGSAGYAAATAAAFLLDKA